jgi:hypothetical protein
MVNKTSSQHSLPLQLLLLPQRAAAAAARRSCPSPEAKTLLQVLPSMASHRGSTAE